MNETQRNFRKVMEENEKLKEESRIEFLKSHGYKVTKPKRKFRFRYSMNTGWVIICILALWGFFGDGIMRIIDSELVLTTLVKGEYISERDVSDFIQEKKSILNEVGEVQKKLYGYISISYGNVENISSRVDNIRLLSNQGKERFYDLAENTNSIVDSSKVMIEEYSQYTKTLDTKYLDRYNEELMKYNEAVIEDRAMTIKLLKESGMRYVEKEDRIVYWYNGNPF